MQPEQSAHFGRRQLAASLLAGGKVQRMSVRVGQGAHFCPSGDGMVVLIAQLERQRLPINAAEDRQARVSLSADFGLVDTSTGGRDSPVTAAWL